MVMDTLAKLLPDVPLDDIPVNVWGYSPIKDSMSLSVRDAVCLRYLLYRHLHERCEQMWREMDMVFAPEPKYKHTDPQKGCVV
jgi:hypothetical protein